MPQLLLLQNASPFDPDVLSRAAPTQRPRLLLLRKLGIASARLGIQSPYILCVSQFYHYKNLSGLVFGFARARAALPAGTILVLAGEEHERETADDVRRAIAREKIGEHVRLLGQVSTDRMSMAHSLEVRVLFCDHKLVEFMAALPFDQKMPQDGAQGAAHANGDVADARRSRLRSQAP